MNEQRSSRQPAPRPICAALAPLLPLLSLGKLDSDEAAPLREHVATCDFCRSQLGDFDTLRDALRRHRVPAHGAEPAVSERVLTLDSILGAVHGDDIGGDQERAGVFDFDFDEVAPPPLATRPSPRRGPWAGSGPGRWSGLSAVAAVLLLVLLAGALFRWHNGRGPAAGILVPGIVVAVPELGTLTKFPLPLAGSQPSLIVAGRDGNLWFMENGRIARISPDGRITGLPLLLGDVTYFTDITSGPDGNLWLAEGSLNKIGRITPAGSIKAFALPTICINLDCGPNGITSGPDGNLWFTDEDGLIGRITPTGSIKEFALPTDCGDPANYCRPFGITSGPDGNLWFTENGGNKIGRTTPAGNIKEFALPTTCGKATALNSCYPGRITSGPDGNLWFAEVGKIGRITPAGRIDEFAVPTCGMPGCVGGITSGPDGNLWFADNGGEKIGRITPAGSIKEFTLPQGVTFSQGADLQGVAAPLRITFGPDGNLWFTDAAANTIDRLELYRSG